MTVKTICARLKQAGITEAELFETAGVNKSTFYKWKERMPDNIAQYLRMLQTFSKLLKQQKQNEQRNNQL
jgi:hypothetical protein